MDIFADDVGFCDLSDGELQSLAVGLAGRRRWRCLIPHLVEIEARGHAALLEYCAEELQLGSARAWVCSRAASAVRRSISVREMLRDGRLTPAAAAVLAPYLDEPDSARLIVLACGLSAGKLRAALAERSRRRAVLFDAASRRGAKMLLPSVEFDLRLEAAR